MLGLSLSFGRHCSTYHLYLRMKLVQWPLVHKGLTSSGSFLLPYTSSSTPSSLLFSDTPESVLSFSPPVFPLLGICSFEVDLLSFKEPLREPSLVTPSEPANLCCGLCLPPRLITSCVGLSPAWWCLLLKSSTLPVLRLACALWVLAGTEWTLTWD